MSFPRLSVLLIGILDTADKEDFLLIFTLNFAFLSGSSRHGNDFLAPVVSNWVTPNHETLPSGFVYWLKVHRNKIELKYFLDDNHFTLVQYSVQK